MRVVPRADSDALGRLPASSRPGTRSTGPHRREWCGAGRVGGEQVEQARREQSRSRAARIDDLVALCSVAAQVTAVEAAGRALP